LPLQIFDLKILLEIKEIITMAGDTPSKVIQRYTNPRPFLAHSSPAEILRQMRNKKASWETR